MAPEQYTGGEIDRRVDVFAAGVVLYQLLTGHLPFAGTDEAVMYKIVYEDPEPITITDNDQDLLRYSDVLARALAKQPAQRYASARVFREVLLELAGHKLPDALPAHRLLAAPTLPMLGGRGEGFGRSRHGALDSGTGGVVGATTGGAASSGFGGLSAADGTAGGPGSLAGDDGTVGPPGARGLAAPGTAAASATAGRWGRESASLAGSAGAAGAAGSRGGARSSGFTPLGDPLGLVNSQAVPLDADSVTVRAPRQDHGRGRDDPPTVPGASGPATLPTGDQILAVRRVVPPGWTADQLVKIELDLARLVGPVARVLVQRGARLHSTPEDLRQALATAISNEADRERFLSPPGRAGAGTPSGFGRSRSGASSGQSQTGPGTGHGLLNEAEGASPASGAHALLRAEDTERVTATLLRTLGPIAKVLVKRASTQAQTRGQFVAALIRLCTTVPDPIQLESEVWRVLNQGDGNG
jgi:hypothetical protein